MGNMFYRWESLDTIISMFMRKKETWQPQKEEEPMDAESEVAISQVLVAASRSGEIFPWNPGRDYNPVNASFITVILILASWLPDRGRIIHFLMLSALWKIVTMAVEN